MIKYHGRDAYRIFSRHDSFYSRLADLADDRTWEHIWYFWLQDSIEYDMACYQNAGILFLWSNGKQHKISTDPAKTKHLLLLVQQVNLRCDLYPMWHPDPLFTEDPL